MFPRVFSGNKKENTNCTTLHNFTFSTINTSSSLANRDRKPDEVIG